MKFFRVSLDENLWAKATKKNKFLIQKIKVLNLLVIPLFVMEDGDLRGR